MESLWSHFGVTLESLWSHFGVTLESLSEMAVFFGGSIFSWYTLNLLSLSRRESSSTTFSHSSQRADDSCHSLFYGNHLPITGEGLPFPISTSLSSLSSVSENDLKRLKTIHKEYIRLSKELYREVVWYLPVVCVDVVLKRKSDSKLLLFYRRDKPAANIWWWPGGRMLKGETFFDSACRKIREETGNNSNPVTPITVLKVWNTFFSDSSWDEGRSEEEKGCQTVNIMVLCEVDDSYSFSFDTKKSEQWAVEAHRWISVEEALCPGKYDKYVRLTVEDAVEKGHLI